MDKVGLEIPGKVDHRADIVHPARSSATIVHNDTLIAQAGCQVACGPKGKNVKIYTPGNETRCHLGQ